MKVYELARDLGVDNEVIMGLCGFTSHLNKLTEVQEERVRTAMQGGQVEIPQAPQETDDLKLIELSIRCLGGKSPYWGKRFLIGRK
jgi:hypothetical protein